MIFNLTQLNLKLRACSQKEGLKRNGFDHLQHFEFTAVGLLLQLQLMNQVLKNGPVDGKTGWTSPSVS
jgi:hypothetical protein